MVLELYREERKQLPQRVFVVWDADDVNNDVILRSALCLAKALCVRDSKTRKAEAADFQVLDGAILAIEKEAERLEKMNRFTETIKLSSERPFNFRSAEDVRCRR
jgi:hypothetical protein